MRVAADEPYRLIEVRNPIHRTAYLVMLPEFPARSPALCTCTDFARRGLGTCKHIEAGWRWLDRHPEAHAAAGAPTTAPPGDVWSEIDRREKDLPTGSRLTGRVLARPGGALFE